MHIPGIRIRLPTSTQPSEEDTKKMLRAVNDSAFKKNQLNFDSPDQVETRDLSAVMGVTKFDGSRNGNVYVETPRWYKGGGRKMCLPHWYAACVEKIEALKQECADGSQRPAVKLTQKVLDLLESVTFQHYMANASDALWTAMPDVCVHIFKWVSTCFLIVTANGVVYPFTQAACVSSSNGGGYCKYHRDERVWMNLIIQLR
jgi:hypothetical protein